MVYIILRTVRGHLSDILDMYDDLKERGYTERFKSGSNAFKTVAGSCKGLLVKPEDVQFLKEQALALAKREAGLPLTECGMVEYEVLSMPHDMDFPWEEELKNVQRNKVQVLDKLKTYNLGIALPSEAPTMKNGTWLQELRATQVKAYRKYLSEVQDVTDEQRVIAEETLQAYTEKKDATREEAVKKTAATKAKKKAKQEDTVVIETPKGE